MITQQQPNSPHLTVLPNLYFPPFYTLEILMTSFNDVMIVCSIILQESHCTCADILPMAICVLASIHAN